MMRDDVRRQIERQVRELSERVDHQIPIARFLAHATLHSLADAEKLRRLALSVVKSRWVANGRATVSDSKLRQLDKLLKTLTPFHDPRRKPPAAVRELLRGGRRAR